jgi:hypothetical protein
MDTEPNVIDTEDAEEIWDYRFLSSSEQLKDEIRRIERLGAQVLEGRRQGNEGAAQKRKEENIKARYLAALDAFNVAMRKEREKAEAERDELARRTLEDIRRRREERLESAQARRAYWKNEEDMELRKAADEGQSSEDDLQEEPIWTGSQSAAPELKRNEQGKWEESWEREKVEARLPEKPQK